MKASDYTANAASAKARSMFAGMLKREDYVSLSECRTVYELTSYLEGQTRYDKVLKSVYSRDFHREQLESLLDGRMYMDYTGLCRYLSSNGKYISEYLKAKREVKILTQAVMHIYTDNDSRIYYNVLVTEFDRASKLDIRAISSAHSYADIVQAAKSTEYYEILKAHTPSANTQFRIEELDCALWNLVYKRLTDTVTLTVKGEEAKQILFMFGQYIDCLNFITIKRLLKYGSLSPDYISSMMISGGTVSASKLEKMICSGSVEGLYEEVTGTSLAKIIEGNEESDSLGYIVSGKLCMHNLRFSVYPNIVVMSYMFLSELELSNIIKTVEGIRYSLSPEEILNMLIII